MYSCEKRIFMYFLCNAYGKLTVSRNFSIGLWEEEAEKTLNGHPSLSLSVSSHRGRGQCVRYCRIMQSLPRESESLCIYIYM